MARSETGLKAKIMRGAVIFNLFGSSGFKLLQDKYAIRNVVVKLARVIYLIPEIIYIN
jgi:hypothetical protein